MMTIDERVTALEAEQAAIAATIRNLEAEHNDPYYVLFDTTIKWL